jgi:DNA-binding beta-propeller fold protein YncE
MKILSAFAVTIMSISTVCSAQVTSGYHLAQKTLVGGEGGWDYLLAESTSRRLYISHGTRVVVMNMDSLNVIGEIPKTEGVHGIAIAAELGHGFVSNGRTSTVTIFDLKSLAVIKEVHAGTNPDAILYDPYSKRLFTFNGRSKDASVFDPVTGDSVATIPLGGKPEFAVTDLNGRIYVNNEDLSEVMAIDSRTLQVVAHWPLAPGESPSGLAIDKKNHRLFSVCGNKLMVVLDSQTGKVITTLPIGGGVDGCAFDPETGMAFASSGEGSVTVVREESADTFSVIDSVATQRGARTITLDPKTHTLFLPTAEFGPPPAPTAERPRPRPTIVPNTFVILQLQRQNP